MKFFEPYYVNKELFEYYHSRALGGDTYKKKSKLSITFRWTRDEPKLVTVWTHRISHSLKSIEISDEKNPGTRGTSRFYILNFCAI